MNKRGSHVEVIISFIIFISFIVFLVATIKSPISRDETKTNMFDSVELAIENVTSSNMTTITINVQNGTFSCISLNNFLVDSGAGSNIIIKDYSGTDISSSLNGNSLNINRGSSGATFFKVYYSGEFQELGTGSGCSQTNYQIGLTKTSNYIFEDKFIELMNEDYQTQIKDLNIPSGINVSCGMVLSNGTVLQDIIPQISTNIYARDTPIEYVDLDGNIMEGYLRTSIW